jgi:hypothetical protein
MLAFAADLEASDKIAVSRNLRQGCIKKDRSDNMKRAT